MFRSRDPTTHFVASALCGFQIEANLISHFIMISIVLTVRKSVENCDLIEIIIEFDPVSVTALL